MDKPSGSGGIRPLYPSTPKSRCPWVTSSLLYPSLPILFIRSSGPSLGLYTSHLKVSPPPLFFPCLPFCKRSVWGEEKSETKVSTSDSGTLVIFCQLLVLRTSSDLYSFLTGSFSRTTLPSLPLDYVVPAPSRLSRCLSLDSV